MRKTWTEFVREDIINIHFLKVWGLFFAALGVWMGSMLIGGFTTYVVGTILAIFIIAFTMAHDLLDDW